MKYTTVREDHAITVMKSKGLPDELANAIGTIARYCIFWEIEHDPEMKQFKLNARFVSSPPLYKRLATDENGNSIDITGAR